ncbi:hypothetical protein [Pseudomonas sp. S2_F03]
MTTSAYQENPIRATVQQMLGMRKMPEFSSEALAENESFAFARDKIFAILQTLKDLLEETPAVLASVPGMSAINANLQAPLAEMANFLANGNGGHLTNAASQLEQNVMSQFWAFTPPLPFVAESTFPALLKSQSDFSQSVIRELSGQRDQLAKNLEVVSEKSDALAKRLEDAAEAAARERAESAATVAKLEQMFTQAEGARQLAFDTALAEQQRLHKEEMDLEVSVAKDTLAKLGAFRDDAARIVQVVGNIGVTGNYQRIANTEGESANFWRWATVIISERASQLRSLHLSSFGTSHFRKILRYRYSFACSTPSS